MKKEPSGLFVVCGLVFALLVLGFHVWAFSRCNEQGGYFDFNTWQCVVIPGARVTLP